MRRFMWKCRHQVPCMCMWKHQAPAALSRTQTHTNTHTQTHKAPAGHNRPALARRARVREAARWERYAGGARVSMGGRHGRGTPHGQGGSIASPAPRGAVAALLEQRFAEDNGGARGSPPPYPVRLPRRPSCKPRHASKRAVALRMDGWRVIASSSAASEGLKRQARTEAPSKHALKHTSARACRSCTPARVSAAVFGTWALG